MANKNKKAFTLVELLAVIVILAVILVIAVPQIINVITESRKGALASSAKLIASSAESAYISNQTLGIEKTIECEDVSNYNSEDYTSCSIKFVDGKAKVTIVGKGKFEGMSVCGGTKENAEVKNGNNCPIPAVEKIESLATESNTEGLITDDFGNIRYAGASPKNYVEFGNDNPKELWRIIGIFNMTTASGKQEKLVKIVRDEPFSTNMSWDSSASDVNAGCGVNEWSQADLMTMLNTYYIGTSTICSYCSGSSQEKCSNDCSSSVTQIGSTYREMIESVVWNTGAITYADSIERSSAYSQERGTTTGKKCTSGTYCNDSVTRTTEWTGKVGLIYPSDYGYASTSGTDIKNGAIGTTNWLNLGSTYWTLSPVDLSPHGCPVWYVFSDQVGGNTMGYSRNVHPALYLKADVSITNGDGSSSNPYQISM